MKDTKIIVVEQEKLFERLALLEAKVDMIAGFVESVVNEKKEKPKEKYLTRKEVAKILRISLPTLGIYIQNGKIPAYRFGGRVLFKSTDVEKVLKQVKVWL